MTADPNDPEDIASFIPGDHLAAVGRIANAWAAFEFAVDQATWTLAGLPDMYGACLTAQMQSMHSKANALLALVELRGVSTERLKSLRKFFSEEVGTLQQKRNRTVHDTRMIHQASGEVNRLQITAQGPLMFGFHAEPIADLHRTRKQVEAVIRKFFKLRSDLYAELMTLPADAGRPLQDIKRVADE